MISNTVKFWSYLTILIPSIICSLFVLYYLLFDRILRSALNNHVVIILLFLGLICEMTMYPWMLYYYQYQGIWQRSAIFCKIWGFIDWGFYETQILVFSWATIERHILIFHDRWVSTKKKRIFAHYLPLFILFIYCFVFFTIVFFFPPCENYPFGGSGMTCISICLYDNYAFVLWDTIVHQILPVSTIVVSSIALLIRFLHQKHRIRQPFQWRKYRKMTIQLLTVSFLYTASFLPLSVCYVMNVYGVSHQDLIQFSQYAVFFSYFTFLLFPFVSAFSLPEVRTKMNNIIHLRRFPRTIHPKTYPMRIKIKSSTVL